MFIKLPLYNADTLDLGNKHIPQAECYMFLPEYDAGSCLSSCFLGVIAGVDIEFLSFF